MTVFMTKDGELIRALSATTTPAHKSRTWPCLCGGVVHHSPIDGEPGNISPTLGACESCERLFWAHEFALNGVPVTVLIDGPAESQ